MSVCPFVGMFFLYIHDGTRVHMCVCGGSLVYRRSRVFCEHMRRLKGAMLKGAAGEVGVCVCVCVRERRREGALSEIIKASVIYTRFP